MLFLNAQFIKKSLFALIKLKKQHSQHTAHDFHLKSEILIQRETNSDNQRQFTDMVQSPYCQATSAL